MPKETPPKTPLCWKMNRECTSSCVAYRAEYTLEEQRAINENLRRGGKALAPECFGRSFRLYSVDGIFAGETQCFELYLLNQQVLLRAMKEARKTPKAPKKPKTKE